MGRIDSISAYLPLLRADRSTMAAALRFAGMGGRAQGFRAVGGWDEDPTTLAVEAARLLGEVPTDRLIFASTSAPFFERAQSTLVAEALAWPTTVRCMDVAGSRRCAVSALLDALLSPGSTMIAAGERRVTKAGSPSHLAFGDGGAAVRVGDDGAARLIGHASCAHDFLDFHASRDHPAPYPAEERFVRDIAARDILAPTILAACRNAGVTADRIAHAAIHEPLSGMGRDIARLTGLKAINHGETVSARAGDLGAAHALYALALAFDAARPGDLVLLAGFGSGCDALIFEMSAPMPGAAEARQALDAGVQIKDHARFLSLTGALELDWGMRAEIEQKAQPAVMERHGRDMMGFIGGRDAAGHVQFPKSAIPVGPDASAPQPLVDVRLANEPARLLSVTTDRLNYTPDPPFWFGLAQFDNGARVLMELTDPDARGFAVGDPLRMRLRIKSLDRRRGMRTYFWKAAPAARPALEG